MSTTSLFLDWFATKKRFPFLLVRRTSPLTFHERLVYSYLVYRTAKGGASLREVARSTRTDKSRTVPKVVKRLKELHLAALQDGKLVALEPLPEQSEWFVWRAKKTGTHWFQQLNGFPMLHPPKGWTAQQTAIYCCLLTNNVQQDRKLIAKQKKYGLAAMLSVASHTVFRTFAKLESLKLLEYDFIQKPPAEVMDIFQSKPERKERDWLASNECGWKFEIIENGPAIAKRIDSYSPLLLQANYTKTEIVKYWNAMSAKICAYKQIDQILYDFVTLGWQEMQQRIELETTKNRNEGKYFGSNSYGMLLAASKTAVERIAEYLPVVNRKAE